MKPIVTPKLWTWLTVVLGIGWTVPFARAEEFTIGLGDTVSDGIPGVGAGRLKTAKDDDFYTFTVVSGQLAFLEGLNQDPAFKKNLRWQLTKPSGGSVFSSYFSQAVGRKLLDESGTYKIRVFSDGTDPTWIGAYSFRISPLPPDQTFPVLLGNQVSDGIPAAGAGRLEFGGAEDNYLFTASGGQLVFFETLNQDAAFKNSLRWQLIKPSGPTVFSSFFSNPQGRLLLPESGQYRIRVYTDAIDSTQLGSYSFRTYPLPPDQSFTYTIGTQVSDGIPAPGAGRLEIAGTEDNYLFTAPAGQVVFFESLTQASAFKNSLRWQLLKPSGVAVFSSFFANTQGRTVLPEAGNYRLRIFTDNNDSRLSGAYSFQTRADVADQQFSLSVGASVSDGKPAVGAGNIETAGSTDTYLFSGRAGQFVVFESLAQAPSLQNSLRWQLTKPSGGSVFSSFFANKQGRTLLSEAGVYKLRCFTDNASTINGAYSFRFYSPVMAHPDYLQTRPNVLLTVPAAKLLFNDISEDPADVLHVDLPSGATAQGGTVTVNATGIVYTPKTGFIGTDQFDYRAIGTLGDTNRTTIWVSVLQDAGKFAGIVNDLRRNEAQLDVCWLGDPGNSYALETSADLDSWVEAEIVVAPPSGFWTYSFAIHTGTPQLYLRSRRK